MLLEIEQVLAVEEDACGLMEFPHFNSIKALIH